jgi:hypothetical protein
LEIGYRVEHCSPFAVTEPDAWDMAVLRQLPQQPGGNAERLCCFARTEGQEWRAICRGHAYRSNGALAAHRGSHDQESGGGNLFRKLWKCEYSRNAVCYAAKNCSEKLLVVTRR